MPQQLLQSLSRCGEDFEYSGYVDRKYGFPDGDGCLGDRRTPSDTEGNSVAFAVFLRRTTPSFRVEFVALLMGLETLDLEHSHLFFEVLDCLNGDLAYFEVGALRFSISLALWSRMKSFSATSSFVC